MTVTSLVGALRMLYKQVNLILEQVIRLATRYVQ